MSTPTRPFRLAPSGPRIGTPPLLVGPGSLGLTFRKHGVSISQGAPVDLHTTPSPIPGFGTGSDWTVILRPGYEYDLQVEYELDCHGFTTTITWQSWYRLRDKASSTFAAWTLFDGNLTPHRMYGTGDNPTIQSWASDATFDLTVSAEVDQIQLAFVADTENAIQYFPELAFARCLEYMP